MWIPHFVLQFWEPETSQETIEASQADTSERKLEVWFFLEDPPARLTEDSGIKLEAHHDCTQTDGTGMSVAMRFQPNADGRLSSIGFLITDTSPHASFRYCHDHLCQLLSIWALTVGTGFSIFGVRIIDKKHEARWIVRPQMVAPEPFVLPSGISLRPEHAAIISLYREGRNTPSPFYRFLCFYKILEAWYQLGSVFGEADRLIREKGLPLRRPRRRITQETLGFSLLFKSRPEFENKTFGELFELLTPFRVKVAHAITQAGTFIDFDKYEFMMEIAPIANLTDIVARQILLDEFELWDQIREAGHIEWEPPAEEQ